MIEMIRKAQPSRSDVHVDRPLTNISIAYMQDPAYFVADRVFPNIPVQKQSDRYFTYDRSYWNRDSMQLRAPSSESAGATYDIDSTPTYFCETFGLHKDIDDQTAANADQPINLNREATEFLSQQALLKREVNFATRYFATGIWTSELTGVAGAPGAGEFQRWDESASTPIEDVRTGKRVVHELTGYRPNKLVLGRPVYDALVDHPDIVGRIDRGQTPGGPAITLRQNLAALFEVDSVEVMDAIQTTSQEGAAAQTSAFIGGKNAMLVYAAPNPGLMVPSGGYTFSWTGLLGNGAMGQRIMRFRMQHLKSDRVEIEQSFDQKLVSADLGYFFLTAVS